MHLSLDSLSAVSACSAQNPSPQNLTPPLNPLNQHTHTHSAPHTVMCVDADVTDGFGTHLGRKGSCRSSSPVLVTVTDTCECFHTQFCVCVVCCACAEGVVAGTHKGACLLQQL